MKDEQINKIWRDLQNRYWESNEDMHIRFARALLAASAPNPSDKQEAATERDQFEAWACANGWKQCNLERQFWDVNQYVNEDVARDWEVWQARAKFSAPLANPSDKQEALTNEQIADLAANYCIGGQYRDIVAFGKAVRSVAPLAQAAEQNRIDAADWLDQFHDAAMTYRAARVTEAPAAFEYLVRIAKGESK